MRYAGLFVILAALQINAADIKETMPILPQLDKVAASGGKDTAALLNSVTVQLENSPRGTAKVILNKISDPSAVTEKQLTVYVWALGLLKDAEAVDAIMKLYRQSNSEVVRGNCLRSLALIGDKKSGEFLLSVLETVTDKDMRFNIINLLAQMQYEPVLPLTGEILRKEGGLYWQSVFVFGKMGDKAIPFLLQKINDKDPNVRTNAINVLGQWLIAPESAKPLRDFYMLEQNPKIRKMILCALERTIPDAAEMKAAFEQIAATEKDEKLAIYARTTLDNIGQMQAALDKYAEKKKVSPFFLERDYSELFKSAGRQGNYELLAIYSAKQDEPMLKSLRERILSRDSDEALYDYRRVNDIIMRNRMLKPQKNQPKP
ncbi:MAG: HEAT repeat domain-containing protein [Victivallaceae bacterium]